MKKHIPLSLFVMLALASSVSTAMVPDPASSKDSFQPEIPVSNAPVTPSSHDRIFTLTATDFLGKGVLDSTFVDPGQVLLTAGERAHVSQSLDRLDPSAP